jgi:rhodanese-related sulfurtransferase
VLDVRGGAAFAAGHVPGSLNIGLSGQFASWAGALVDAGRELLLVTDDAGGAQEAATRLARVGLDRVAGYLDGGIAAWQAQGHDVGSLPQVLVDELKDQAQENKGLQIVDVRRAAEYALGHVPGAVNHPLDRLEDEVADLDRSRPIAVICAGGYRSAAAASLLRARGFKDLRNVVGGTTAWVQAGFPVARP